MKFTIETSALLAGLRVASVATSGRDTLPILGNVKLDASENHLTISATNLDIYVQQKIPARVSKEGATTVPFDLFSRLVNRIESTQIAIEQKGNVIDFKAGDVRATIETLPAAEFPEPLKQEGGTAMILGTELNGQPKLTVRLNAKFLIETLSVLNCENVRIQLRESDSPVMIEDGPFMAVINRLLPA